MDHIKDENKEISYIDVPIKDTKISVSIKDLGTITMTDETPYVFYSEKRFGVKGIHPSIKSLSKELKGLDIESVKIEDYCLHTEDYLRFRLDLFQKLDSYIDHCERHSLKSAMEAELAKLNKDSEEYARIKSIWEHRIEENILSNEKYLSMLEPEEREQFKYFKSKHIKRLSKAKRRSNFFKAFWIDFPFAFQNSWDRFKLARKKKFKRAYKLEEKLNELKDPIELTKTNKRDVIAGIENYIIGIVGIEKMPFVDENKTIGENMISILMGIQGLRRKKAYEVMIQIMKELGIPDAEDVCQYKFYQFINQDFQARIILSYMLAFNPKMVIVDCASLLLDRALIKELISTLIKIKKERKFILAIYDDVLIDKTFEPKEVYVISTEGKIEKKQ